MNTNVTPRLSFIDKEKDKESNLGDFGVRKYDDYIGRFTSIDPMFDKYYSLTPYHYSLNNPITNKDPLGSIVNALDRSSRISIRQSVEHIYEKYIDFDKQGNVQFKLTGEEIKSKITDDPKSNFAALVELNDDPETIYVKSVKANQVLKEKSGPFIDPFTIDQPNPTFPDLKGGDKFLSKENKWGYPTSINGKNMLYVASDPFYKNPAIYTAHGLYLHALYYLRDAPKGFGHENPELGRIKTDEVEGNATK